MTIPLLALYAGPDQVMVVTSVFATVLGFVLMLWNKLVVGFGKLLNRFGRTAEANEPPKSE
jgi:hypothetical protein